MNYDYTFIYVKEFRSSLSMHLNVSGKGDNSLSTCKRIPAYD